MDRPLEAAPEEIVENPSRPLENTASQVVDDLKKGTKEVSKILALAADDTGENFKEPVQKNKTALRKKFEAEARVIEKRIGKLEDVRKRLGLSQRKICQLLMVDPSAWSRWVRPGNSAPPSVYRTLEWYLMLENKHPGTNQFWLSSMGASQNRIVSAEVEKTARELKRIHHETQTQFRRIDLVTKKRNLLGWAIALVFLGMFLGQLLIR